MTTELITPSAPRSTWDVAWKTFFDSSKVWCRGFVTNLLGFKFADYFVQSDYIVNESERVPTYGADKSTDAVIAFRIDNETKKILAEFQSYADPIIGMRAFNYALNKGQLLKHTKDQEMWALPETFIVHVRKHSDIGAGDRCIYLSFADYQYCIKIPVVNAFELLPEIQILMNSGNSQEGVQAMYSLYSKVTKGMEAPEIPDEEFKRACALLAIPKAFTAEGASDKEVSAMIFDYDASRPTVMERIEARGEARGEVRGEARGLIKGREEGYRDGLKEGEEKGLQQGLQVGLYRGQESIILSLMKSRNWTREQVIDLIINGVLPGESVSGKHNPDLGGMGLEGNAK